MRELAVSMDGDINERVPVLSARTRRSLSRLVHKLATRLTRMSSLFEASALMSTVPSKRSSRLSRMLRMTPLSAAM